MKRLIIIFALASFAAYGFGQSEALLPMKSSSAATDTLRVIKDGESALMLRSTLLSSIDPYTFSNGLTESGGGVTLGGSLTEATELTGNSTYNFNMGTYSSPIYYLSLYSHELMRLHSDAYLTLEVTNNSVVSLQCDPHDDGSTVVDLRLSHNGISFRDEENSYGAYYAADYSANFTNRSIVDKEYVDDAILSGGSGMTQDQKDSLKIAYEAAVDTIPIDTAAHMLVDSLSLDGGIGVGNDGDTVSFQVGANVLEHRQVQDSIIFYSAYSYCEKTSGNVTIRYWYQSAPGGSKTYITAPISVTTGTPVETTSFTTVKLPPGVIIGADITAVGSILPDKLRTYLYYYEKRAY